MSEKIKRFVIDCNKWICGTPDKVCGSPNIVKINKNNCMGEGQTKLLNEEGYMCCLGQVCLQCGIDAKNLKSIFTPVNLNQSDLSNENIDFLFAGYGVSSDFCDNAISINDSSITTVEQKIESLTNLFKNEGYEIEFINKPF